jgi:hypothetical protein
MVDGRQRHLRSVKLGDRNGPVQGDDRRGVETDELVVKSDDLRPVSVACVAGGGVHGVDRGEDLVSTRSHPGGASGLPFAHQHCLYTTTIIDRLSGLDEAPWGDWQRGERISPRALAGLLRPYNIHTKDVREGGNGQQRKGLSRADLIDAWSRYLPREHRDTAPYVPRFAGLRPVAEVPTTSATCSTVEDCPPANTSVRGVARVAHGRLTGATAVLSMRGGGEDGAWMWPRSGGAVDVSVRPRREGTVAQAPGHRLPRSHDHAGVSTTRRLADGEVAVHRGRAGEVGCGTLAVRAGSRSGRIARLIAGGTDRPE